METMSGTKSLSLTGPKKTTSTSAGTSLTGKVEDTPRAQSISMRTVVRIACLRTPALLERAVRLRQSIWREKTDRFTRIGTILHQALVTEATETGGRLLHCSSNGGGGHSSITTYLLSHEGLKMIKKLNGEWNDPQYGKHFDTVFATPLKPNYQFVAARPKSNAEPVAGGKRR